MSKSKEKKSMIDLIAEKEQRVPDIEKSVQLIHKNKGEKQSRIAFAVPESLHKNLKKIVIDEDTDLRGFLLQAVLERCEQLGYPIKSEYADLYKVENYG